MKNSKNNLKESKTLDLKNHLLTRFTQVLKSMGLGEHLFDKKLKKTTKKLAKAINKKKLKEQPITKTATKPALIKASKLQPASKTKIVKPVVAAKPKATASKLVDPKPNKRTTTTKRTEK
jgi:hypothetical protein